MRIIRTEVSDCLRGSRERYMLAREGHCVAHSIKRGRRVPRTGNIHTRYENNGVIFPSGIMDESVFIAWEVYTLLVHWWQKRS